MTLVTLSTPPTTVVQEEVSVTVVGYFYHVDFGPGGRQRAHRVGKDKRCICQQGTYCPAVAAVYEYLKAGGERSPDPPPGYYPVAPVTCPVCQAEAFYDPRLSSKRRGAGWGCSPAGSLHYWEAHVQVLRQKLAANPWLFPPVVIRQGSRLLAYDGLEPGDQVLYPGLLRKEVKSWTDQM